MTTPAPSAYIYSTGAAFGNHYSTEQVIQALIQQQSKNHENSSSSSTSFDVDFATRVLNKCGFAKHSFALPLEDIFRRFTREEYLQLRKTALVGLAERAGQQALESWGGRLEEITHLFWGTMTGALDSPTIDIQLTKSLGLSLDVERTSIDGMGCLTGFRLLNLARQVSLGDPNARVLVIVADLRSALGNSMPDNPTKADIVSVSLFRDGASAAVVGGGCITDNSNQTPCYEIVAGASRIVEGTSHLVDYFETNEGAIRLQLHRDLPEYIGKAEPDFVANLLKKGRRTLLDRANIEKQHASSLNGSSSSTSVGAGSSSTPSIAMPNLNDMDILCHTGGPKVLKEVANALGVTSTQMHSSWEIMRNNGNLSGASNLCVLNHHNELARHSLYGSADSTLHGTSEWAVCLSMGPGVCLEGVLIRDVRRKFTLVPIYQTVDDVGLVGDNAVIRDVANVDTRKVVQIVGGGIAGLTLAAALDPKQYNVRIFEATNDVQEKGYGLAIWPNTMKILRDEIGIKGLDLRTSQSMTINRKSLKQKLEITPPREVRDKGFMQRSSLLRCLLSKVEERHPGCILTNHTCLRVRFGTNQVTTTYEVNGCTVPHTCDLLVGADGVNSVVRKYVSLNLNSQAYGHMTAYRFLVCSPSDALLEQTKETWNMSISSEIHSPCYHISNENNILSIVVLEYDGKPPSHPRPASMAELQDVAQRSGISFIMNLLHTEKITDLMCYSTFHVDCAPWHQLNAVIIGDAAHAYGPLTAKMANLAINDAHTLAGVLNHPEKNSLAHSLEQYELNQRPKFEVTRIRTLRHLQLYSPMMRPISSFLWRYLPSFILNYFGSIFAYDYAIYSHQSNTARVDKRASACDGVVGIKCADPLWAFMKQWMHYFVAFCAALCVGVHARMH